MAVVQARLGSERLPGKVLAMLDGRPVLRFMLERLGGADSLHDLVAAVPESDDSLARDILGWGFQVFRGSETDLLSRYARCAREYDAATVVRLTADCPLVDISILDHLVAQFGRQPCDYLTAEGFPRGLGDIEVIRSEALARAADEATTAWDREHVGPYIVRPENGFTVRTYPAPSAERRPELRVCIDEPADLEVVRFVATHLSRDQLRTADIVRLLDANPEIAALNAHVQQRS